MDVREFKEEEKQQATKLRFTINYDVNSPVAVADFTKSLDGLNQLYSSCVYQRLQEKKIDFRELEIDEEKIGQFYIEEIKPGSIICTLTAGIVVGKLALSTLGVVADVLGIVRFCMMVYDKHKKKEEKPKDKESDFQDLNGTSINNNSIFINNIIQPVNETNSIKLEALGPNNQVIGRPVVIDNEKKQIIDSMLEELREELYYYPRHYYPYNTTTLRNEYVRIEFINGQYYATILDNPMVQSTKLPLEIRNEDLKEHVDRMNTNNDLNNYIFLVEIELHFRDRVHSPNDANYVIYGCFGVYPWEFRIKHLMKRYRF